MVMIFTLQFLTEKNVFIKEMNQYDPVLQIHKHNFCRFIKSLSVFLLPWIFEITSVILSETIEGKQATLYL